MIPQNIKNTFPTFQPTPKPSNSADRSSSLLETVISLIAGKKWSEAMIQSCKMKTPLLQDLIKTAYENHLLKYVLHSKDKILQVNPQGNLLHENSICSIRAIAVLRQESAQAKANYQGIADNIKKILATTGNFYQCTLPNRSQLNEIKSGLHHLFQELKKRRQNMGEKKEQSQNDMLAECKEQLLDIMNFIVPTQMLKQNVNRQKNFGELVLIVKQQIKDAFFSFKNQLELLQSRTLHCQKSLQNERNIKHQQQQQIEQLRNKLITSQQYIDDLEGIKAATQMENLGLHSRIKSNFSDQERQIYECEMEQLKAQKRDLLNTIKQYEEQQKGWVEELQNSKKQIEQLNNKLTNYEQINREIESNNKHLNLKLNQISFKYSHLELLNQNYQKQLFNAKIQIAEMQQQITKHINDNKAVKSERDHYYEESKQNQQKLQQLQEFSQQLQKLHQEVQLLQGENARLQSYLQNQEESKHQLQRVIEELSRTNEDHQLKRQQFQEQIDALSRQNEDFRIISNQAEQKFTTLQAQYEYLVAQKDYYANYYHSSRAEEQQRNSNIVHTQL